MDISENYYEHESSPGEFTRFMFCIVAVALALGTILAVTLNSTPTKEQKPCSSFSENSINYIPVRCLSYFNITKQP